MPKLITKELNHIIEDLPDIIQFNAAHHCEQKDELFLCALGFEERCLGIPRALSNSLKYSANNAIYFKYSTNKEDNEKNEKELNEYLKSFSSHVESTSINYKTLGHQMRNFLDRQIQKNNKISDYCPLVTIDISAFSSRLLLLILTLAFDYKISIRVVYTEAATYFPTKEKFESEKLNWLLDETLTLERGISEVSPSLEHPGLHIETQPHCIFHFPNFKCARGHAILQQIDSSFVDNKCHDNIIWFIGEPPAMHNKWRKDAIFEINKIPKDSTISIISTLNYKEVLTRLEIEYLKRWENYNISISNLGSKMQTLATCLFSIIHRDVRIMNASPKIYNAKEFSLGISDCWQVNFGDTTNIINLLNSIGELELISNT